MINSNTNNRNLLATSTLFPVTSSASLQLASEHIGVVEHAARRIGALVASWQHWWLSTDGSIHFTYSSPARSQRFLPEGFWVGREGKVLQCLIEKSCEEGVFQCTPHQVKTLLEQKVADEGIESGEVVAFLLKSTNSQIDVTKNSLSFALVQKLRQLAHSRIDDSNHCIEVKKEKLQSIATQSVGVFSKFTHELILSGDRSEATAESIYEQTVETLKNIRNQTNEIHTQGRTLVRMKENATAAVHGFYAVEDMPFRECGYETNTHETLSEFAKIHQLVRSLIFDVGAKQLSLVEVTPTHRTKRVVGCSIGELSQLFVPRIGTYDFSSKTELFRQLDQFLREVYESKNSIQLSCWHKKRVEVDPEAISLIDLD